MPRVYLNQSGVTYLVQNIKALLNGKVDKEAGKTLSTNDYTTAEKTKLASLENYDLPIAGENTLGGFKVGVGLSINSETGVLSATGGGAADSVDWENITSKPADLVHTADLDNYVQDADITDVVRTSDLNAYATAASLSDYATTAALNAVDAKVTGVYRFKGSVTNVSDLQSIVNPEAGDVYNVTATNMNYAWVEDDEDPTASAWDPLGMTIDLSGYIREEDIESMTNADIDALFDETPAVDPGN